jgi:lysophospholipase L1-like esterase
LRGRPGHTGGVKSSARGTPGSTGVVVSTAVTGLSAALWGVWRDLRRARRVVRLDPPVTAIDVELGPRAPSGADPPWRIVALGDSSVAGIGADSLEGCLAVQIGQRVADATGRRVHVRALGVSGARTADVTTTQVSALDPDRAPDAVVVVVGMNDIVHVTTPWAYRRAVRQLYSALHARLDAPVIVCSMPEIRALTIVGHPLRDLAVGYGRALGWLQRRAVRRLPGMAFVDARRSAGPDFRRVPGSVSVDGFHPSSHGYALLADALAPAVVTALAARSGCP